MKIGLLTFHCAHNYGAVLQAYALQEYLKSLGHEVEFIKYEPEYLLRGYRILPVLREEKNLIRMLRRSAYCLHIIFWRIQRYNAFKRFISENLNVSDAVVNSVDDISGYDAYIVGSDQIWNTMITRRLDPLYWLDIKDDNSLKISYAPSLCSSDISIEDKKQIAKYLSNFDAISVRETQTQELLQPLTDRKINVALDPVLLVEPSLWENWNLTRPFSEKYVLVYYVKNSPNISRIANSIAKEIGAKVITLVPHPTWKSMKGKKQTASAQDFVRYFKHAECIVTSSFHGTVFSIVFNRPFYTVQVESLHQGAQVRMKSLLSSLALDSRYISESSSPKFLPIDYAPVNSNLKNLRAKSQSFLKGSFNLKERK